MNAVEMIKERRSIRKYTSEIVPAEVMEEVIDAARFAPSWGNYQIARYNLVTNEDMIKEIGATGVHEFIYNVKTLKYAKNVLVLSYVKGKSGKMDIDVDDYATNKANQWEMFDTGIACQTFCLAAHEKGIGTCIFGLIDDERIAKIIGLPEGETVAAVVTYGYINQDGVTTKRKEVNEITRFVK